MTSSTRCSSRRIAPALALLAAALGGAGCAHRAPARSGIPGLSVESGERPRIVLLPVENVSGAAAPTRELLVPIELALRRTFDLVTGDILEEFLARHRIRYTGGIDAEAARAARDELGADAVLITSLETYRLAGPPAFGATMRLVTTDDDPAILWMEAASRSGDESPGLLRLGIVESLKPLQDGVLRELTRSLAAFAAGKGAAKPRCGGAFYGPKVRFRSSLLDEELSSRPTLAVIPFLNQAGRRGAGDALALEFVRHLVATGRFRVVEPGVVREFLLRARVMMPGGISLETTRLLLATLGVDLVLSGVVLDYVDSASVAGPIRFTATMLDGGSGEIVWHSGSYNRGDEGVFAFGVGRVATSGELTCRMVADVVQGVRRRGGNTPQAPRDDGSRFRFSLDQIHARATRASGSGDGKTSQ